MSAPKSTIKTYAKNGNVTITYEDNCDASQYYIHELTRAAMRDVGKFVCKSFKTAYYSHFKKWTGNAGKSVKYKVIAGPKTTAPRVEVGIKGGDGFYSMFEEFGSLHTPKLGLLTHAVEDNIAEIIKIESQYLSGLDGEASRLEALINESEMEGGTDE